MLADPIQSRLLLGRNKQISIYLSNYSKVDQVMSSFGFLMYVKVYERPGIPRCVAKINKHLHSRPQRPRSFWSAPRIATSGLWPTSGSGRVQQRKSAIHGLPVTLHMLWVKSDKSDWFDGFWSQSTELKNDCACVPCDSVGGVGGKISTQATNS